MAKGIALVPEERRAQGLMLDQSVGFNINVASLAQLRVAAGPAVRVGRQVARPRRAADEGTEHQDARRRRQDHRPLGRQPAEDDDRALARGRTPGCSSSTSRRAASMSARARKSTTRSANWRETASASSSSRRTSRNWRSSPTGWWCCARDSVTGELIGDDISEARIIELSYLHERDRRTEGEDGVTTVTPARADRHPAGHRGKRRRSALIFISRYGTIIGLLAMIAVLLDRRADDILLDRELPQHPQPGVAHRDHRRGPHLYAGGRRVRPLRSASWRASSA